MSLYSEYYLAHYGVKGMKWGVRRYLNKDGTLTEEGKKRQRKLDPQVKKEFNKAVWDSKGDYTNRNKVYAKMEKELDETEEGKAYKELVRKRGIFVNGKMTGLSYMKEDWSDLEKVMETMVADTEVTNAYNRKTSEIGKKYISEVRGAALKDLGFEDTQAGRDYLEKLGILQPR